MDWTGELSRSWYPGCNRCTGTIGLRISVENFGHLETSKSGARHRRIRFPNQMNRESAPLHATELDSTNFVEWRERMIACETDAAAIEPRTYPAYPRWPLLRVA